MTETLLRLVPEWGALLVALANFLACMALPIPASLVMLAGGAFAASGDLPFGVIWAAGLAGAVLGDQAGYLLGRHAGGPLLQRIGARRKSGRLLRRAVDWLHERQRPAVFYSRWLVSALGPYVNLAAGAARLPWRRFAVASASGEAIWVTIYLGLGYRFSANIQALGSTLGNLGLAVAAGVVALLLGRVLWGMAQERD